MGVTFNLDAMVHYYEADCKMEPDTSRELAARVLRRAEVSKVRDNWFAISYPSDCC